MLWSIFLTRHFNYNYVLRNYTLSTNFTIHLKKEFLIKQTLDGFLLSAGGTFYKLF